jgi:hypothetical protein
MFVHVPRVLRLRKSNGQSNCKQRYSENPQHWFENLPTLVSAPALPNRNLDKSFL